GREREKHCEREVDRADLGAVEYENAEREGEWGGDPKLEKRPGQCDAEQQGGRDSSGFAASGVGFGDNLAQFFIAQFVVLRRLVGAWLRHGYTLSMDRLNYLQKMLG